MVHNLTVYWAGGRDQQLQAIVPLILEEWAAGRPVVFHCNNSFHRAPVAVAAVLRACFGHEALSVLRTIVCPSVSSSIPGWPLFRLYLCFYSVITIALRLMPCALLCGHGSFMLGLTMIVVLYFMNLVASDLHLSMLVYAPSSQLLM